ncbi:hypothetical protein DH2020_030769 [Rehmannia glutinosa]|uniref:Lunapark zinc ribbon domain-containing protein n=1 Tax=Rehmannia glutinosa TaxID=99300 RepID=A0ABR0VLK8_REHGL
MAAESKNDVKDSVTSTDTEIKKTKKKKGLLSRLWGAIFRLHGDDFEKRLQYISKEEAAVLSRITRRSQSWRRMNRHLIIFSVLFEKDLKTLERLRAERQSKIDELKEKTNYYTTQQLIQRYDPDPAAKAAAATVLASKLGADSGLKVYVGDEPKNNVPTGKSNDAEVARTSGLRNRKPSLWQNSTMQNPPARHTEEEMLDGADMSQQRQMVVEHHPQAGLSTNGGWIARLAALLVGEDPTQSYALICGNCHMHNGKARTKEDFPYVTYYCPHCNALNRPKQPDERVSGANSPAMTSTVEDAVPSAGGSIADKISASNSRVAAVAEIPES